MTAPRVRLETRARNGHRIFYLAVSRSVDGKRQRKFIPTGTTHRRVAERQRRALEEQIAGGFDPWQPAPGDVTVAKAVEMFVEDCASRDLRPASIATYRNVLGQFSEHAGAAALLSGVTTAKVRSFAVQSHLAPASRRHRLRHLKAFLAWACKAGHIESNPADDANLPREKRQTPKLITPNDFERILTALDHTLAEREVDEPHATAYWLKPLVQTTYYLALRRGEVLRLRWRDVDLEARTVAIRRSKGGDRQLPMPAILYDVLAAWHEVTGPDSFVFVTSRGTPPDADYVGRSFRRVCKLAGVSTGAFHALRHGSATALLASGASTREVQAILGHSNIQVTEKYLHVIDGLLRSRLDGAFSTNERAAGSEKAGGND